MSIDVRLIQAPPEYSQTNEQLFRRDMELTISRAIDLLAAIADGSNVSSSQAHKHHQYLPTLGVTRFT
jgi:hypothetical protein